MNIPAVELAAHSTTQTQTRFGRGWYCLGLSSDYGEEPVSLDYFEKKPFKFDGQIIKTFIKYTDRK